MSSSLEKLVENLKPEKFQQTRRTFGSDCELLVRKGVFPYDWFDSLEKLCERKLPPKEEFYSKLNDCNITD